MICTLRQTWLECSNQGECAEGTRNEYKGLVGKPEGMKTLDRRKRRSVDNIKMDLEDICEGVD
jgi:hypothetical protein